MPVEKAKKHRVYMDMTKVDHFIEFANRPYFSPGCVIWCSSLEIGQWCTIYYTECHMDCNKVYFDIRIP